MFPERTQTNEPFKPNDFWLMVVGMPFIGFLTPLIFFRTTLEDGQHFLVAWAWSTLYTAIYWLGIRSIFLWFVRRYGDSKLVKKRILLQITPMLVYTLGLCNVLNAIADIFGVHKPELISKLSINLASLMNVFLGVAIYESIYFFTQWKNTVVEKEQLERQTIQSQLETLKNQVNPHFLFNSLNTLNYIISEDSERAQRFVQQLSKVYRYILEIREKRLISISEELDFLKAYIFLIKERFGDNLVVSVDIPEKVYSALIPPLSLQMLFENAIKHNIISTEKPLKIEVFVENDHLIVRNNLQKKNQVMESTGFGLDNIRNRYTFLSDQKVEVIVTQGSFIVSLPLIRSEE